MEHEEVAQTLGELYRHANHLPEINREYERIAKRFRDEFVGSEGFTDKDFYETVDPDNFLGLR